MVLGKNEEAYIMDAKVIGNLGRYMNHSCRPNVFVQNVFVSIIYIIDAVKQIVFPTCFALEIQGLKGIDCSRSKLVVAGELY